MKEKYLKSVDKLMKRLKEGTERRDEPWPDIKEFKNHFVDKYDIFAPIVNIMVGEDGFSMDNAVMFIYGYAMGRGSVFDSVNSESDTVH